MKNDDIPPTIVKGFDSLTVSIEEEIDNFIEDFQKNEDLLRRGLYLYIKIAGDKYAERFGKTFNNTKH